MLASHVVFKMRCVTYVPVQKFVSRFWASTWGEPFYLLFIKNLYHTWIMFGYLWLRKSRDIAVAVVINGWRAWLVFHPGFFLYCIAVEVVLKSTGRNLKNQDTIYNSCSSVDELTNRWTQSSGSQDRWTALLWCSSANWEIGKSMNE